MRVAEVVGAGARKEERREVRRQQRVAQARQRVLAVAAGAGRQARRPSSRPALPGARVEALKLV